MNSEREIVLRNWTKKDFPSVRDILLKTWQATYSFIPKKDIHYHFNKFYNNKKLDELFNNSNVYGIISEVNSTAAGWMKLYNDRMDNRFYISSLYILPEFQRSGVGKKMLLSACEIAMKEKYDKIWLGVMKENISALYWYRKHGFIFTEEKPFRMGSTEVMHLIGYKVMDK